MSMPRFSEVQKKLLLDLGVPVAGIPELEIALIHVRNVLTRPAARNATIKLLDDVESLSRELVKKLALISRQRVPAHAQASAMIEAGYWRLRPDDIGGLSIQAIAPPVNALALAAREAKAMLPNKATRHRKADPSPVEAISNALLRGWNKEHGSNVFHERLVEGGEVMPPFNGPTPKPFPRQLCASLAENGAFRAIVGICYEAVGGSAEQVAAIRAHLARERAQRRDLVAGLDKVFDEASLQKPRNRTSRKK